MGNFKGTTLLIFWAIGISLISCRVPESDLFPHDQGEDERFTGGDDDFFRYNLKVPFTFFNKTYESIFVSPNGLVSFESGVTSYTAACKPSNTPVIMPYWSDVLWTVDRNNSKILYRETTSRTLLNKAARDVFKAFPELRGRIKQLSWMFVVTYKDVPFYGAGGTCKNIPSAFFKRNTFQLILTSDGTYSFALFYYSKIEWTTGTASEGNCEGLGGLPAKAGFDYGDGTTLHTIPGSCTNSIINIPETSNINEPGKWVFRIDSALETAECEEFDTVHERKLRLTPSIIPYMGIVPLELEGPCISEGYVYTCVFHDNVQGGDLHEEMEGQPTADFKRVVCPMPHLNRLGRVKVELIVSPASSEFRRSEIAIGNEQNKTYSGYLYVVNNVAGGDNFRLSFVRSKDDPNNVFINATWDPVFFQREADINIFYKRRRRRRRSVLNMPEQPVDMVVETFDGYQWNEHGTIQDRVPNTGHHHGRLREDSKALIERIMGSPHPEWISIHLRRAEQEGELNWSKLAANLIHSVEQLYSAFPNPFARQCLEWGRQQERWSIPNDTRPCPPTLQLAQIDQNFQKDAAGWTMPFWHPGGAHSFRQRVASPSNAGSQCVYDNRGGLMVGPMGGGTLDMFSPNYDLPLHLLHDVLPYLTCCRLSGSKNLENCANIYYKYRPSDDGSRYPRPRPTRAVGDPHITTFDGLSYTFNGVGEFIMVLATVQESNRHFKMQARMEQYVNPHGIPMNASVYTAAVMEESVSNNVTSIQVSYSNGKIFVLLDGESPDFGEETPWGFSMKYKTAYITFDSATKVMVSFSSGFNFEFEAVGGNEVLMNIVGMASSNHRTRGLLGNNDGNMENDFECPDGTILARESMTPKKIHEDFGMKWLVPEQSSIFTYSPGKSYANYKNLDFQPRFLTQEEIEGISEDVRNTCDNKIECIYDLITTGSAELANETKISTQNFEEAVQIVDKPVRMCPSVQSPENGLAQVTDLLVGGELRFSCAEGYELKRGPTNCTCIEDDPNPRWSCTTSKAKCIRIGDTSDEYCEPPPALQNGVVIGMKPYSLGSEIELKCNDGRDIFWKNCRFNGLNGLCIEKCDVKYKCVLKNDTAVWEGYAGAIENVRCLTKFAGNFATILKKKSIVLHLATGHKMITDFVRAYLYGC